MSPQYVDLPLPFPSDITNNPSANRPFVFSVTAHLVCPLDYEPPLLEAL